MKIYAKYPGAEADMLGDKETTRQPRVLGGKILLAACIAGSLTACSNRDLTDLQAFVDEVKSRPAGRIEPLPEIKPYESYSYQSTGLRQPFESTFAVDEEEEQVADNGNGIRPDLNRRKEALEGFPLDTLRMVGTLAQFDEHWGLIQASDGTIHRIQPGNYVGQNHGRVTHISEEQIELMEIVPTGQGGWQEREASIALSVPE